jgi:dTDP-4-amino-4,6-dideoxygalactose transaminase
VVVPHAIVLSGNIPVFVDCEAGSPNMSYEKMEQAITARTRAIMVTHLFGYPMDVDRIAAMVTLAEKKYQHKIYVVQDVAHSFGARHKEKLVTEYGDIALFGLNISKTITSVFGGMITTNDSEISDKLRTFRDSNFKKKSFLMRVSRLIYLKAVWIAFNPYFYSIVNLLERSGLLDRFSKYYDEERIYFPSDWDYLPSGIEANVGLVQLDKYDAVIERRSKNALLWKDYFKNDPDIKFFPGIEGATYSHCVGRVQDQDSWVDSYRKKNYQLGILIEYCIPEMSSYKKYSTQDFPVASDYSRHMVNFPIWMKHFSKKELIKNNA